MDESVKQFYSKQFELLPDEAEDLTAYVESADEIIKQVEKDFSTVLEMGAGKGHLANELAKKGKNVTAIELIQEKSSYAIENYGKAISMIHGSFYEVDLPKKFDVVLYIGGFGAGAHSDQVAALQKVVEWMKDDGVALIEVYNPRYWQYTAGRQMYVDPDKKVLREYGYNVTEKQMTDTWWLVEKPREKITHYLACYEVHEIAALCSQVGLTIVKTYPGGAMDWENGEYHPKVSLAECLSYRLKLEKK